MELATLQGPLRRCSNCGETKGQDDYHPSVWNGQPGWCKPCVLAKQRKYHAANPYASLTEEQKEAKRLVNRRRVTANPWPWRDGRDRRRAERFGVTVETVSRQAVIERDGTNCYLCGEDAKDDLTLDHVLALRDGGPHTMDNVRVCCRTCNTKKGHVEAPRGG